MSAYADKIAMEVIEADERAGIRGVCHPPLEWHKAVALARAVSAPRAEVAPTMADKFCALQEAVAKCAGKDFERIHNQFKIELEHRLDMNSEE